MKRRINRENMGGGKGCQVKMGGRGEKKPIR